MSGIEVGRSDFLLAIVAAAKGKALSRVHLQKVAFLVSEEFKGRLPKDFYTFDKHNYGPFCIDIYNDVEMLHYWGWIQIERGKEPRYDSYSISRSLKPLEIQMESEIQHYIRETVNWVADMSFGEIVRAVYWLFPEYRENSVFSYSQEEAELESFARSIKQLRQGKTYSARERLQELKRALSPDG